MKLDLVSGAFVAGMMCLMVAGVTAAETTNLKTTITTPLRGNSEGAITVSADSPFVQKHLHRMREKHRENKKTREILSKKNNSIKSRIFKAMEKRKLRRKKQTQRIRAQSARTETIQLRTAENIPPVVNQTSSFVFRDITQREAGKASQSSDLEKRRAKIEALRQASAQR